MVIFDDIEEVEEWLAPLGYVELWEAVAPYRIFGVEDREHCDGLIAKGTVKQDLILDCLKAMVRVELTKRLNLPPRIPEPVDAQYIQSVH